jgi:eukaryotic-like serine/threonine-protein kinase
MSIIAPGTLLHDRYRVVSVIGSGGVATVYRATDEQLGRDVALKVIQHPAVAGAELQRIEDEVRLIAGLNHPALVTLFDVVSDESSSTLVMQLVEGEDLSHELQRGPVAPRRVAAIGAAVAGALAFVHESGVIHRDVKPANILLPSTGPQPALLADFGIARLVDSASITATGTIIGTASYLSPEQARGSQLSGATDVYSLGLVLLEALTGERAFAGTAAESMAARISSDPAIPTSLGKEWTELLTGMLHRDPESRPTAERAQTALAALDSPTRTLVLPAADAATEKLAAAETERLAPSTPAPAPSAVPAPREPGNRRRGLLVVIALVLALLVIVIAASLAGRGDDTATQEPSAPMQTSATPTPEPIEYPEVEGKLGEKLRALEEALIGLDDQQTARALGEQLLVAATAAASGDLESARAALDDFNAIVAESPLSAADRDGVVRASDDLARELDELIRKADKPGNGNKPGKKP